jgi:diguanylate cyclase (GGDEF)-like protein/PAS domain S-box-containing protein
VISRRFNLPVVYLTAYAGEDILQRAMESAPYGYVLKPFQPRELHATIRSALARVAEEKKTRRAEKRFRLAMEAAELGVLETDRDLGRIALDGVLTPMLLAETESFSIGRQEFLKHLEDEEVRDRMQSMLASGMVQICAAWRRDDGQRIWLEIHASYFSDEDRVIGILRDVTEKVESEANLRQAAVVFESSGECILILDSAQRVCMTNRSFQKQTGWASDEVVGRHPDEFLHTSRVGDRKSFDDALLYASPQVEVTCRRRDDTLFPAWENIAPVIDSNGRITHYVLSFCDISALRSAESRLSHIALHDALTGLGNRHQLGISLRHKIMQAASKADSDHFALIFIDLDGFKNINDSLGHSIGDELLVEVTCRLKRALRQDDIAIRMGGDEFVVILDSVHTVEAASQLCRKLLAVVAEPISTSIGQTVRTTASIGIAMFPEHADSADELIRAADTAMYAAKEDGRNCYATFSQGLAHRALERMQMEQGLRSAIGNQELELLWQPVVDLRDGAVLGAEALLRWNHPTSGRISPERFIPVAEETGLILTIGDWVLEQACQHAASWAREGLDYGRLAINVSARQLQQEGFTDRVQSSLARYGIAPRSLEIELTESALQRGEAVQVSLRKLEAMGVQLALDDFGTGFSSLSMLKFLPLNRLKIDRAFVRDISSDPNDMAIARTISAMASTLGLAVTAEGVETDIQRNILIGLSVREAQGWLYHPALPADSYAELLRRQKAA